MILLQNITGAEELRSIDRKYLMNGLLSPADSSGSAHRAYGQVRRSAFAEACSVQLADALPGQGMFRESSVKPILSDGQFPVVLVSGSLVRYPVRTR